MSETAALPFHTRYLRAELERRKAKNSLYSLRSFARHLGIDPSSLSRLLKGKQRISLSLCVSMARKLALSPQERRAFLESVVEEKREKTSSLILDALNLTAEPLSRATMDYRCVFEGAHDAILILTPEQNVILEANPRACEIYGRERGDLIGRSFQELGAPSIRQVAQSMGKSGASRFELTQKKVDGASLSLDVSASIIEFNGRKSVLAICRELNDRFFPGASQSFASQVA